MVVVCILAISYPITFEGHVYKEKKGFMFTKCTDGRGQSGFTKISWIFEFNSSLNFTIITMDFLKMWYDSSRPVAKRWYRNSNVC